MKLKPTAAQTRPSSRVNFDQRLGLIEYRSPASLTPYINDPLKHPEKKIVKLMASIDHLASPRLSWSTSTARSSRVMRGLKRLGLAEIPVLVADKWTNAEVRAYRLADNRLAELSSWDDNILAIELADIFELGEVDFEVLGWEAGEIDSSSMEAVEALQPRTLPTLSRRVRSVVLAIYGTSGTTASFVVLPGNGKLGRPMGGKTARVKPLDLSEQDDLPDVVRQPVDSLLRLPERITASTWRSAVSVSTSC